MAIFFNTVGYILEGVQWTIVEEKPTKATSATLFVCVLSIFQVLSPDLSHWGLAYGLIRDTAHRALSKGRAKLSDGEVLPSLFTHLS